MKTENPAPNAPTPALYEPAGEADAVHLLFKQCPACPALAFPPGLPACGACGHPLGDTPTQAHVGPCVLREFVTVHAPLLPGMTVPMVVGEIEIAPGVIRQGIVDVASEAELSIGQMLRPMACVSAGAASPRCVFVPHALATH